MVGNMSDQSRSVCTVVGGACCKAVFAFSVWLWTCACVNESDCWVGGVSCVPRNISLFVAQIYYPDRPVYVLCAIFKIVVNISRS